MYIFILSPMLKGLKPHSEQMYSTHTHTHTHRHTDTHTLFMSNPSHTTHTPHVQSPPHTHTPHVQSHTHHTHSSCPIPHTPHTESNPVSTDPYPEANQS